MIQNVYIYASNIRVPKYTKQIQADLKGETGNRTKTVRNFNTPIYSNG